MSHKPSKRPDGWADEIGANRLVPDPTDQQTGFQPGTVAPAGYFNWLHGFQLDWIRFIEDELGEGTVNGNQVLSVLANQLFVNGDLEVSGELLLSGIGYNLKNINVIETPGASTYTVPAGINALEILGIGGGGAGGSAGVGSDAGVGGGGASGALFIHWLENLDASYDFEVGAAGTSGGSGGATKFGTDKGVGFPQTANGGGAGDTGFNTTLSIEQGGSPDIASEAKVLIPGHGGQEGIVLSSTDASSGAGAPSVLGGGKTPGFVSNSSTGKSLNGVDGQDYGAGGGGALAVNTSSGTSGGDGAAGVLIIAEYE